MSPRCAIALSAALLVALPAQAAATSTHSFYNGSGRSDDSWVLIVEGGTPANDISVGYRDDRFIVNDRNEPVKPGRRCRSLSARTVSCKLPEGDYPNEVGVYGERGDDRLRVTSALPADVDRDLDGGRGGDLLLGAAAEDQLHGARGNDRLRSGAGDDELEGGGGGDVLLAGGGDDSVFAGFRSPRGDPDRRINCGGGSDDVTLEPEDPDPVACENINQLR